ncbi:MAG: prepilin-type N-terminal cleavage/methylation domain-containing protein [Solirubrobacterales bacterium]|nr:prepilin-type N-terminal cleavage/methylation domain-containing protein [Solirubrobacterales bacterium]
MSRLRALARDESGFSVTELLMAMSIGSIVLWALMQFFVTGIKSSNELSDRVEAAQRGRLAMDRVTTLMDSMLCLNAATPPVVAGSTGTSVTFYADLAGASATPVKYQLTYDAATKQLNEAQYVGQGALPGAITYPGSPTRTRVLATNVVPARDGAGAQQPVFRYYAFQADGTVNEAAPLAVPLTAGDASTVVRVAAQFRANPERTKAEDPRSSLIAGQSIVASADANTPAAGPNCYDDAS